MKKLQKLDAMVFAGPCAAPGIGEGALEDLYYRTIMVFGKLGCDRRYPGAYRSAVYEREAKELRARALKEVGK
jgi:hypothetical protein